jgi:hypothetical protein
MTLPGPPLEAGRDVLDVDFHATLQFAGSCWKRFIESFVYGDWREDLHAFFDL